MNLMSNLPPPRYTLIEAIKVAVAMARRALEEVRALARMPGPQGDPGPPGAGFDDMKEFYEDDGRVLVRQFFRGDKITKEFRHITCTPIDRGVWRDGEYTKGDCVTWGGSTWTAQVPATKSKPGESDDWRLSVKRGRDGKDGKPGEKGLPGPEGRAGRDLTQITRDGQKF